MVWAGMPAPASELVGRPSRRCDSDHVPTSNPVAVGDRSHRGRLARPGATHQHLDRVALPAQPADRLLLLAFDAQAHRHGLDDVVAEDAAPSLAPTGEKSDETSLNVQQTERRELFVPPHRVRVASP